MTIAINARSFIAENHYHCAWSGFLDYVLDSGSDYCCWVPENLTGQELSSVLERLKKSSIQVYEDPSEIVTDTTSVFVWFSCNKEDDYSISHSYQEVARIVAYHPNRDTNLDHLQKLMESDVEFLIVPNHCPELPLFATEEQQSFLEERSFYLPPTLFEGEKGNSGDSFKKSTLILQHVIPDRTLLRKNNSYNSGDIARYSFLGRALSHLPDASYIEIDRITPSLEKRIRCFENIVILSNDTSFTVSIAKISHVVGASWTVVANADVSLIELCAIHPSWDRAVVLFHPYSGMREFIKTTYAKIKEHEDCIEEHDDSIENDLLLSAVNVQEKVFRDLSLKKIVNEDKPKAFRYVSEHLNRALTLSWRELKKELKKQPLNDVGLPCEPSIHSFARQDIAVHTILQYAYELFDKRKHLTERWMWHFACCTVSFSNFLKACDSLYINRESLNLISFPGDRAWATEFAQKIYLSFDGEIYEDCNLSRFLVLSEAAVKLIEFDQSNEREYPYFYYYSVIWRCFYQNTETILRCASTYLNDSNSLPQIVNAIAFLSTTRFHSIAPKLLDLISNEEFNLLEEEGPMLFAATACILNGRYLIGEQILSSLYSKNPYLLSSNSISLGFCPSKFFFKIFYAAGEFQKADQLFEELCKAGTFQRYQKEKIFSKIRVIDDLKLPPFQPAII